MLKTFRARAAVAAALLTVAASPAAAENYDILMMEHAFFPELSYVQPGDTITFINMSGLPRRIEATDKSWQTVNVEDGGSVVVAITQDTYKIFVMSEKGNVDNEAEAVGNGDAGAITDDNVLASDGVVEEAGTIEGKLNFAAPPQLRTD